jgi:hypothetical protein
MEYGLTNEEIMRLNFFVRYYGSYDSLEAAIRYFGASALDHSDYVPVPLSTDSWEDTNESPLDEQLVAMDDPNVIAKYTELLDFMHDDLTYDTCGVNLQTPNLRLVSLAKSFST